MATDFTTVNKSVQALIDAAVAAQKAADAAVISDLRTQLAAATSQGEEDLYWFKADNSAWVYVYNPLTGTKRHLSSAEAALLRALYGTVTPWPVTTVPAATADAIPLVK